MTVFRFTSEFSGTQQAVNVWHVKTAGSANSTDANQAITAVDAIYEAIKTFLAPGTWLHGQRVITLDETPNRVISASVLSTVTTGATHAPAQAAQVVSYTTAFIGKSFTGRSYFGPLANTALDGNGFDTNASLRSALATPLAGITAPLAGGAQFCVWSEKLGIGTPIFGANAKVGITTQRRRLT